ncbi:MAG: putative ketoacyl reductase [Nitrospinaceae bacterium]|nr:MAG: putative ketoacyl reductase [Nitrospinaceae bacterium]
MEKSIVVTGAGQGIGQSIAKLLAEQGFSLLLLGRNVKSLETTRKSLENPESHQSFSCDIRNRDQIHKALTDSGIASLYAVVANAGAGGENHYCEEDRWKEIVDTNLTGSYFTVQECLPFLKKAPDDYKKIVIISSILARLGVPGYSAYCASKAGLLGLMRSLAAELTSDKILVNAICPGWVNTAMAHEGLQGFADALSISKEEACKQAMAQVPLGKMSEPEEIAHLVAFLISDAQTSFTGQTLDINNGALMP